MDPTYHVLLIGVDAYAETPLNGCVNDIDAIQRVLVDSLGVSPARITRLVAPRFGTKHEDDVPSELPTRDRVLGALDALGTDQVADGDRVFIYYSGHGTQVPVVNARGDRFMREALIPKDNVVLGERRYLFDWELNHRLGKIAARTQAVTFILDCCCAAGATRQLPAFDPPGSQARYVPPPAEPYVLPADQEALDLGDRGIVSGLLGRVQTCQVIAACQDDERARESGGTEGAAPLRNGELTRALVGRLQSAEILAAGLSGLRWGRLWRPLLADVAAQNAAQHPWMSGDFARLVFGGPVEHGDVGYGITRAGDGYRLDAGSLAGVTAGAEVAVYESGPPSFPALDSDADRAIRVGLLRVVDAARDTANAVAAVPFDLPPGARGRLVRAGADARLLVALEPPDAAIAAQLAESLRVQLAPPGVTADVKLVRVADGSWVLTDDVFGELPGEPVLVSIPPELAVSRAREIVEHYYRYSAPLRLARNCTDLPGCLVLRALDVGDRQLSEEEAQTADLAELPPAQGASYQIRAADEASTGDSFCLSVQNTSSEALRVTILDAEAAGSVIKLGEAVIGPGAHHRFWSEDQLGVPFVASLPGATSGVDRIVAIGTTNRGANLKFLEVASTFEAILRATARDTPTPAPVERWTSAVKTIRMAKLTDDKILRPVNKAD